MKNIGITINLSKPRAPAVAERLAAQAARLGLALHACEETPPALKCSPHASPRELAGKIDLLMALGGDGTMLHAARLLNGEDIPLLGVNIGSLGFMTSVADHDLEKAMECLASGDFKLSHRTVLEASLHRDGAILESCRALNDVVIGWGESSRVLTLNLAIHGEAVGTYVCDGLICATPTGSTGHSLSAGGPILLPETPVFLLNPICPHTLSNRPMVIPDDLTVEMTVVESSKHPLFVVDGQDHHVLKRGDRVVIRRAERRLKFVHLPQYSYFDLLRRKLHWRASNL